MDTEALAKEAFLRFGKEAPFNEKQGYLAGMLCKIIAGVMMIDQLTTEEVLDVLEVVKRSVEFLGEAVRGGPPQ